ncbi:MAG: biotin/lipoyl-containing protein [Fimbriiglobus sp.]
MSIVIPELGTPGHVSLWLVGLGERVEEGDRVLELLIPGMVVDVHAPSSGFLTERIVLPGDPVTSGQVAGTLCVAKES